MSLRNCKHKVVLIEMRFVLQHAISLSQQMRYYKEYQSKLAAVTGKRKAAFIIKEALHLACFGTADFLQNYYVNPKINKIYTPHQYSTYLVGKYTRFIKVNTHYNYIYILLHI